jgi:hypothetical protein
MPAGDRRRPDEWKEDGLTRFERNMIRRLALVVGTTVLCAVPVAAQSIHERDRDLGPTLEPEPPAVTTDYIRIKPLPGNNRVPGGCTRVQGTGLPQYTELYMAFAWNNGPNGIPEDGGGDDINLGRVFPAWSTDVSPTLGTIHWNGLFEAAVHRDCGQGYVYAKYRVYTPGQGFALLTDSALVSVIPPDWLPDVPQDLRTVGSDKQ